MASLSDAVTLLNGPLSLEVASLLKPRIVLIMVRRSKLPRKLPMLEQVLRMVYGVWM